VLRICCEIIVVILLLPHILRKNNIGSSTEHDITVIEDPNDDGDMDCSVHRDMI
jgi:hypothetical protein